MNTTLFEHELVDLGILLVMDSTLCYRNLSVWLEKKGLILVPLHKMHLVCKLSF